MQVRSAGWVTDLMVRRLAGSHVDDRGDHIVVTTPSNPNFWWGNFVLAGTDFGDAARWLDVFAAAHPGAAHVALGFDGGPVGDLAGYGDAGLEIDVSTVLTASVMALPSGVPGVDCRALRGDADWAQALDLMLACNPPESDAERDFTERKAVEWRELTEQDSGSWFGAFVDGRMCASLGVLTDGGGVARYQSVETHPDFRRRGLARALTATAGNLMLRRDDVDVLVIVSDPEYHATMLYRSLGFADSDVQVQASRAGYR